MLDIFIVAVGLSRKHTSVTELARAVGCSLRELHRRIQEAGMMHAGRYVRFNPKIEKWTEYVLPEPYGLDRQSWVDNSTDPVTVWYTDHEGQVVRIQPLD